MGGVIVDPFCGSGTVLHESALKKVNAYGVDINPAAICLARFSKISAVPMKERFELVKLIRAFLRDLCKLSGNGDHAISTYEAASMLRKSAINAEVATFLIPALLLAFGNQSETNPKKILNAEKFLERNIASAPYSSKQINCEIGDARRLKLCDRYADYLVTSPPYINVFNYHQNYRAITEALGYAPLKMSRAEIGANRKHRQNRFMTVIQYCLDMALFLLEAMRILKKDSVMTIVLGRESKVRGVAFPNSEIIGALAAEGFGWKLESWRERKFLNRFGEHIYEDVLTLRPPLNKAQDVHSKGRLIGVEALRNALKNAPREQSQEIDNAIEYASKIQPSPYVLEGDQLK